MKNYKYHCMFCRSDYADFPMGGKCPKCGFPMNRIQTYMEGPMRDALLVKIGSEFALNNMRKGNFWMQSPKYFQIHFENEARDDVYESAFDFVELDSTTPDQPVSSVASSMQNLYRILCFGYIFVEDGRIQKPNERMRLLGSHFSYVNTQRLVATFKQAAEQKNVKFDFGGVHYLGSSYKGIYTPFCKMPKFSYQEEQRAVFYSEQYALIDDCEKDTVSFGDIGEWFSKPVPIDELYQEHPLEKLTKIILD